MFRSRRSARFFETFAALALLTGVTSIAISTISTPAMAQAAAPGAPSPLMNLVPIVFMFVIMWFLILRPQQKRQKEHQKFLSQLKRGDEVLTSSGILGRIEGLTEKFVTLEIAPDVRIKVLRSQVAGSSAAATAEKSEVKA